jgi:hypothetical protein
MDPAEVLAIEVRQYAAEDLQTLVPRVIGQTAESERRKSAGNAGTTRWDEARFFDDLSARRPEVEVAVAHKLLQWAARWRTRVAWGKGLRDGSFTPCIGSGGTDHYAFTAYSNGSVEILFQWYAYKVPFAEESRRAEMLRRLNEIPGVAIPADAIARRPSIPLATLAAGETAERFLAVFDWYHDQVVAAAGVPSDSEMGATI